MWKKWFSLALCLCLLLGFVACGGDSGTSDGTGSNSWTSSDALTDGTSDAVTDTDGETSDSDPLTDTDSGANTSSVTDTDSASNTSGTSDSATDSATDSSGGTGSSATNTGGDTSDPPKYASYEELLASSQHYVGLCDQLNCRILVCDLSVEDWSNDRSVVWEYKYNGDSHLAGVKFRDSEYYNQRVVVFCTFYAGIVLSYDTKTVLHKVTDVGGNPHSVELLPDGTLITASSTDKTIKVFAPGETTACQTFTYSGAHGVLYDPKYDVVWLLGNNKLSAYSVSQKNGKPQLTEVSGMQYYTSQGGMHDLAPYYGNPDALLVTCNAGILLFDKVSGRFTSNYLGGFLGSTVTYAPGVGNFETGVLAFTQIVSGQTVYKSWCTDKVYFYASLDGVTGKLFSRQAPNDAYYKLRVFNFNYQ